MTSTRRDVLPIESTRIVQGWELLRLWHFEALDSLIHDPKAVTFTRTSYVSAPRRWKVFAVEELVGRLEQLLLAHYRIRTASLQGSGDVAQVVPFGFDYEWVTRADMPAQPEFEAMPWMFPCATTHLHLFDIADRDMDMARRVDRLGIDSQCYRGAFAVFRIDEDDTWHIVRHYRRAAMFAARYQGPAERDQPPMPMAQRQ
jgi:hypothetical protein